MPHSFKFHLFLLTAWGSQISLGILTAEESPGMHLSRTMELLESSSEGHKTPIKILFYGQSITAQGYADRAITQWMRERYPAAQVSYTNPAIGGYEAPTLRRTAWQDLYNQNPDLVVFHVYGGEGGELEEIFRGMKEHLTAEVLVWTHHTDGTPEEANGTREKGAELMKSLAAKYGFEVADFRALWKATLETSKQTAKDFTSDLIHLNDKGGEILGQALLARFKNNPAASGGWKERIHTLPLDRPQPGISYEAGTWKVEKGGLVSTSAKPLRIAFTGNRVDLVGLAGTGGNAKILLDGKVPSSLRYTMAAGRSSLAPGAWWPAVTQVKLGDTAVPQMITMNFRNVAPDGSSFVYEVTGSVSGAEGEGSHGQPYRARSGSFSLEPGDLALGTVKRFAGKDLPPEFVIEWPVFSMSRDQWRSPTELKSGEVAQDTVVRCWTDGPHVLEVVPEGDEPVGIREVVVFSPSGHAKSQPH